MVRSKSWRRHKTKSKENKCYKNLLQTDWNSFDTKKEFQNYCKYKSKKLRDNMTTCSCWMCGNPDYPKHQFLSKKVDDYEIQEAFKKYK